MPPGNVTSTQEQFKVQARSLSLPRILAGALGLILLTAALLKAMDMELFIRQIGEYGIISRRVVVALSAWGLIVLECTLGMGLLIFHRPRLMLSFTALLLLVFVGATSWAWLAGTAEHCGCFGTWMKHSPGEAALANLVLLGATIISWLSQRRLQIQRARAKALIVTTACLIGLALPIAFGFPVSGINLSEPKAAGVELGDLRIPGLEHIDLRYGVYLITLMSTDCLHCQEAVHQLNALAETADLQGVVALCTSEESECLGFTEKFQPVFPIGQISEDVFWRLVGDGDIPRFILVEDQQVQKIWDQEVPNEGMIRTALSG